MKFRTRVVLAAVLSASLVAVLASLAAYYTEHNTALTTVDANLRNNAIGNFLDRCAISLPIHNAGEAPVGLMRMGETMGDQRLFAIAASVEAATT